MQSKLLRAVETKTINPLGSTDFRKVNTRIITATSRDLKAMIQEGSFRKDLYYRINTLMICLKPLRERKEDIPQLCCSILDNYKIQKSLSFRALNKLLDYSWPGNIRELRSTLIRANIHASYDNEITENDILLY
jgi:transcriptional regulator with PAS, ATPase and Fis domain